jgi:hypothetical protein
MVGLAHPSPAGGPSFFSSEALVTAAASGVPPRRELALAVRLREAKTVA